MASNLAFNILLDVDGKQASEHIDNIRRELEELSNKKVGVDITDAEAQAKLKTLKADLDEIAAKHPSIDIRLASEEAQIKAERLKLTLDEIHDKRVNVDVNTSGGESKINALMTAGVALGPAIIPVAAAVSAALAAIGTGAVIGIAGIGAGMLAFHGISDAVKELGTAQEGSAGKAAQAASQQISSANSIANAQDSLRNAIANVGTTQLNVADSIISAQERLRTATEAVGIAQQDASHNIAMALQHEQDAEVQLTSAQHSAALAQVALTQARVDAQRALQDMAFSVQDNALAQRRAQIDLETAQKSLNQIAPGDPRREQAQLTLDEARQRQVELQTQGQRLASDKAAADAKGVEGSNQVTSAQDALVAAQQRVVQAQQQVADSAYAASKAQTDGARSVAAAEQAQADAARALTKAEVDGAAQIAASHQAVISAQRSLQDAQASAAAQAAAATTANANLLSSYDKLSPAGKAFADFIHNDLEPKLKGLQATAAAGMLPGVEQGLKNMLPMLPQIDGLIGTLSRSMGDLAARAGAALNSPFWHGFIAFIDGEAGPSITTFGHIMGNLAQGGAALLMAFKPVWDQMGTGLDNMTAKFANWSRSLGSNPEFQKFLEYVRQNGPLVVSTLGNLILALAHTGEAMGPLGHFVLTVVDGLSKFIQVIPTPILGPLVDVLWGGYLAWKAWLIIDAVKTALIAVRDAQIAATIATWAMNAALWANPIMLVVGALVILGLGIYEIVKHWQVFKDAGIAAWNGLKDAALWVWNNVLHPVFDWIGGAVRAVGDAFMGIPGLVRDAWALIKEYARAPIQFVIDVVYNNGILPVWNGIASIFGGHQLGPVHMATGGVIPGYGPGVDDVHILASKGEGILVPEAVRALGPGFVHWANREFSGGRVTGGGPGQYADGGIIGDIAGVFTDPLGTLRRMFSGVLDAVTHIPGSGMLHDAMTSIPGRLIDGLVEKAKSLIVSVASSGGGGAGVAQWSPMVQQALGIMHQDPSNLAATLRRMNQESGGNPTAVNRSDINWQNGTPSVGLMQVIGPTYAANKVMDVGPYMYGVSVNPLANTLASMHYAVGRYGSLASAYNRAGGYANGGIVTSPQLAMVGEAGPEAILPLNRPHRAGQLARQAGLGGATVNVGPVHVHSDVDIDTLAHRLAFSAAGAGL